MKTFTFNRPLTLLFALPMLVLIAMFTYGLSIEFRLSLVLMLTFSLALVLLLVYVGLLRRMSVGKEQMAWATPLKKYEMSVADVRSFGVVKYRSFRFIYVSKAATDPFVDTTNPIVTDADTFVMQFRPRAWAAVTAAIAGKHPQLKPQSIIRQ